VSVGFTAARVRGKKKNRGEPIGAAAARRLTARLAINQKKPRKIMCKVK